MPRPPRRSPTVSVSRRIAPTFGLARTLSKRGLCSRSQGERLAREGRVRVDGRIVLDPEHRIVGHERIEIDGADAETANRIYIVMNKPRGIVVSAADEQGRETVYSLLDGSGLPWLGPVGRLDKASEGLLLLSNDTTWAAGITAPETHVPKTYHVQVVGRPDETTFAAMRAGVLDAGETLRTKDVTLLRHGDRHAWLQVTLDEGRNRHLRRLLAALGFDVKRLVRVAIGTLTLGDLPKGRWRALESAEVDMLRRAL